MVLLKRSNKLSAENAKVLVDVVRKLWGPGRKLHSIPAHLFVFGATNVKLLTFFALGIDLLLCHLVELNATEAVNQVIDSIPPELCERRLSFKALANLVQ